MHCKLCNSPDTEEVFQKNDIAHYQCAECRFVFATPEENANFSNQIEDFEDAYLTYLEPSPEDAKNYTRLLKSLVAFGDLKNRRVIDVGAGSGKFVRFLRQQGIEAYGLEPSKPLFQRYLSGDDFFYHGTVEQFAEQNESRFDVVVASDVLEHVDQPMSFFHALTSLLAPGGMLYISTCDVSSLAARLLGRRWHFYNRYHLSLFSPQTSAVLGAKNELQLASVAHPARYRSFGYLLSYFFAFFLGKGRVSAPSFTYDLTFPINLFDVMELFFVRDRPASAA